jgi:hypothetical protein
MPESIINKKEGVFTKIGAWVSLQQEKPMPELDSSFPSINNKEDIVPYLLDVLKVVVGTDALMLLIGEMFTNLIDEITVPLKKSTENSVTQPNSSEPTPTGFWQTGYTFQVKEIDIFGAAQIDPSSTEGSLMCDVENPNFNNVLFNALTSPGVPKDFGVVKMTYNESNNTINFKPVSSGMTIGDFFKGFINSMVIIDKKVFMASVLNLFYGTITANLNKSVEQVAQELLVGKQVEDAINGNTSFTVSPDSYDEIWKKAQELANGTVYYDLGCGLLEAKLGMSALTETVGNTSGSTDPFYVANQMYGTVPKSMRDVAPRANENKQTIMDGFCQQLIKLITDTIVNAVTTAPQYRALQGIWSAFANLGKTKLGNPVEDMKEFRTMIMCNINAAMELIIRFIFGIVVAYLTKLLVPIAKKIVIERINQYIATLRSLQPIETPLIT